MRISTGIGLVLLLALAPAASSQSPVATAQLGAGEVLLELNSFGTATTRADAADIAVLISVDGPDHDARNRQYRLILRRISEAARAAGGEISGEQSLSDDAMMVDVNMMDEPAMNATTEAATQMVPTSGSGSASIRLPSIAGIDRLLRSIETAGGQVTGTTYRLADDRLARRQARDTAIAAARAEADSYAASLNMRVGRIARVTERTQVDFLEMMTGTGSAMTNALMSQSLNPGDERDIQSYARIGVDFILVPR